MAQRPSPSSLPSHIDDFQIMSPDHPNLQTLTSLYKKTTQAFLLRNYDTAYSLCMSAISKLADFPPVTVSPSTKIIQIKIWCLYINLVAALLAEKPPIVTEDHEIKRLLERPPEKICDEVYTKIVVNGFGNEDGEIPGEIIIAWCYEKVVKLNVLHVLPKLKEWDAASSFLDRDEILDKEHKKAYEQALSKLKEKSNQPLSPKKPKIKKEKTKKDDANGYGNEFLHNRLDYGHMSGVRSSIDHNIHPNGSEFRVRQPMSPNLPRGNHRQSNNHRSFMGNPRSLSIAGNNRNSMDHRQNPPPTTAVDTMIDRCTEAFVASFKRVASKGLIPNIIFLFVVYVIIFERKRIKREFVLKGISKFWETVKSTATIP